MIEIDTLKLVFFFFFFFFFLQIIWGFISMCIIEQRIGFDTALILHRKQAGL